MYYEAIPAIVGCLLLIAYLLLAKHYNQSQNKSENLSHLLLIIGITSILFSALESLDIIDYL